MAAARHFTMGALSALIAVRRFLASNFGADAATAAETLRATDADLSSSDFSTALELHERVPLDIDFAEPSDGLRRTLAFLIALHRPTWMSPLRLGRRHVARELSKDRDAFQCFRAAGLVEGVLTTAVVGWWDSECQKQYLDINTRLMLQGRQAEELSLDRERMLLRQLGISAEPEWIAAEDNTVGYDILSYRAGPTARMIEVKSSTANPPKVIVTRNEWNTAARMAHAYLFHFWDLKKRAAL